VKKIAEIFGKKIEFLIFQWNVELALHYWYGAGEAEIFDYAVDHSTLLQESESFYKITGRYIVQDINQILSLLKKEKMYFHKQGLFMTPFTVSTAFLKISKRVYQKYLYQKQIALYTSLDQKDYKSEVYFKNHFPLERVWYCFLRPEILHHDQQYSVPIFYRYPHTTTHGLPSWLRNIAYRGYCFFRGNQYGFLHKWYDKIFYKKTYKKLIRDHLLPYSSLW
jgi:hypothetical protein